MSDHLPHELMIKILTKLPPKSLIRFRCVSKSWNSLISSPQFVALHTEQALLSKSLYTDPTRIVVRSYSKARNSEVYAVRIDGEYFPEEESLRIEYPFRDYTRFYFRVVGYCNGVFCLLDDLFGQAESILLWNPVIKRKVSLPVPQSTLDDMFVVGFGFDVEKNEFKVVRIPYVQLDYGYVLPPKAEVFALSKGEWHTVEGEISKNCVVEYFWTQVFINRNVHWVAYRNNGMQEKVVNLIMVFDITHEVFGEMPLPEALENELPINLNAVDLRDSIGIVQYDERLTCKSCCIWIMKNYGDFGSWSKLYNVDLEGGIGVILGLRANGDVLLSGRNRGLVSYNPVTRKHTNLGMFGTKDSFYVGAYFESLALLIEGNEARERVPSDSDSESESECESSVEDDDGRSNDVEKSEFRMQCSMAQYLTALLKRPFL